LIEGVDPKAELLLVYFAAVAPYVMDRRRVVVQVQRASDQQSTMAVCGVFLAAHHCHAPLRCSLQQPRQSVTETWDLCQMPVQHSALAVIEFRLVRSTAEFPTQEHVLQSCVGQQLSQRALAEMGGV